MMNKNYACYRLSTGAVYIKMEDGRNIAMFSPGENGQSAFEAVKYQIAKDGGSLFNADTGTYEVGEFLDQLTLGT